MKILNRYFSRQLVLIFIVLLLILTGLAWMMQVMSMMKFLLNYGVQLGNFLGLTALMIPFIISIIMPFVTFIAVIFVYDKLILDHEITVVSASGLSPGQLSKPALILAAILTVAHIALNLWVVPASQAKFYTTQWNLRYGLAHMKLQESAFTQLAPNLVVYVDKVSGHDLSQIMLSDTRDKKSPFIIFAENGKLVTTMRGLSIVMTNGSLQVNGDTMTTGTFETFDMDLNLTDKNVDSMFKVRRIPTNLLIKQISGPSSSKQHKMVLSELCTRFLNPWMNLILTLLCLVILLKTSFLRRRTSFAPAIAVLAMGATMALYMSASSMITGLTQFFILGGAQILVLIILLFILYKR